MVFTLQRVGRLSIDYHAVTVLLHPASTAPKRASGDTPRKTQPNARFGPCLPVDRLL